MQLRQIMFGGHSHYQTPFFICECSYKRYTIYTIAISRPKPIFFYLNLLTMRSVGNVEITNYELQQQYHQIQSEGFLNRNSLPFVLCIESNHTRRISPRLSGIVTFKWTSAKICRNKKYPAKSILICFLFADGTFPIKATTGNECSAFSSLQI